MTVEVFAWPPVGLVGHEHTISRPVSSATGLTGKPIFSQSQPTRRLVSAIVGGIGRDKSYGGYIEQLKWMLDGKPPLIRMTVLPQVWLGAVRGLYGLRGRLDLDWAAGDAGLKWLAGGTNLKWQAGAEVTATAGVADGRNYIDCVGLPALSLVAYPSELVTGGGMQARVLAVARSDSSGSARVFVDAPLPSGEVVIGALESLVFTIDEFPRAVQPLAADYRYEFRLTEAFAADYAGGFREVDPWR